MLIAFLILDFGVPEDSGECMLIAFLILDFGVPEDSGECMLIAFLILDFGVPEDSGECMLIAFLILDFGVPEDSGDENQTAVPSHASAHHDAQLHFPTGDENQTVVLWVLTLQHLLAARLGGAVNGAVNATSFCALSDAQYQWQRYDQPKKEWACMACTFQNRHNSPYCHQCETPRPIVTLCPSACKCSPRRPTPLPHRCETPRPIVTLCPCLTPLLDGEMLQVSAVNCL